MDEDGPHPITASTARPARTRWRPGPGWRDLLTERSPEALLNRIADGDPLSLRQLVALRLRAAAVFLDVDKVHLRALAGVAFEAAGSGPPQKRRQIVELVDRTIAEAVEDVRLRDDEGACGIECAFTTFAKPLGLSSEALRRASDAFNAAPLEERQAFFALVVDRLSLEEAARTLGEEGLAIARRARRALDALLLAAEAAAPTDVRGPVKGGTLEASPRASEGVRP